MLDASPADLSPGHFADLGYSRGIEAKIIRGLGDHETDASEAHLKDEIERLQHDHNL